MVRTLWAVAAVVAALMLVGCAGGPRAGEADYVLGYLKTGPESGKKTKEESAAIFAGHMSNMSAMAERGELVIAGPFEKPADTSWRGIFVIDRSDVGEAERLMATDPGIVAGVFVGERRGMRASTALRETKRLEDEAKAGAGSAKGDPRANIRKYVMVTASDADRVSAAIGSAGLSERVVWCGRFRDRDGRGGVFVLDAADPADVRAAIEPGGAGACAVDGWWSTRSLERLPAGAKAMPGR